MALFNIHPSLARFTNNQKVFELIIESTNDLLKVLCQHYPALGAKILGAKGELTPYVNIYVNGKNLNQMKSTETISNTDKIDLVTALVGG